MDKNCIILNNVLEKIGIFPYVNNIGKLPMLKQCVNGYYDNNGEYLFLLRADGQHVAHGKYPMLSNYKSVYLTNELDNFMHPAIDPVEVRDAIRAVLLYTTNEGGIVTYKWEGRHKVAHTIRLHLDGVCYILGI